MIDKRQIIKEHLKDCDPDQLHDGSYVTIKECVEMMEILEQQLVKNLGLHNVIVPKGTVCEHPKPSSTGDKTKTMEQAKQYYDEQGTHIKDLFTSIGCTHTVKIMLFEYAKEKEKEWYSKLLAKLIEIQQGDRDLNEYKKEIEAKLVS